MAFLLSPSRRGAALVTTAIFLVVLISVSTVVIDQSVSHLRQESERAEATKLLVNAESAANIAIDWLQSNTDQLDKSAAAKPITMPSALNGKPVSATYTYLGTAIYQGTGETQDV